VNELPDIPPTSWAVLGCLGFGEELSGYDIKKWADWSIGHFYWSPSFSQVYSELKRLEKLGYATSRQFRDTGVRGRRVYQITDAGRDAVRRWAIESAVEPPILKHGVMLRVWMGHLNEPDKLKRMVQDYIDQMDQLNQQLEIDSEGAAEDPAWAFPRVTMNWAKRYYAAERELAEQLLTEIDEAHETLVKSSPDGSLPLHPGHWREVEAHLKGATGT